MSALGGPSQPATTTDQGGSGQPATTTNHGGPGHPATTTNQRKPGLKRRYSCQGGPGQSATTTDQAGLSQPPTTTDQGGPGQPPTTTSQGGPIQPATTTNHGGPGQPATTTDQGEPCQPATTTDQGGPGQPVTTTDQSEPGQPATTTDQGDADTCVRHAIAKAITQHAHDYKNYDFKLDYVLGVTENINRTIGSLWPSAYDGWSFHAMDQREVECGKNKHYSITTKVEKISKENSSNWKEALQQLEERHIKEKENDEEQEAPNKLENIDREKMLPSSRPKPPNGPPQPTPTAYDANPMYVLTYYPNKKEHHCVFVKSVVNGYFNCLNSWGKLEAEPKVLTTEKGNKLWKIALKYDKATNSHRQENANPTEDSSRREDRKDKSEGKQENTKPGSRCLDEVLDHISKKLTFKESKKLLRNLQIADGDPNKEVSEKLEDVPWFKIKNMLELLGKYEIIDHIKKNTFITQGLRAASNNLRQYYVKQLKDYHLDQPLSPYTEDTVNVKREDVYIDLVVLPSSTVDKEWSNSDRAALKEQQKIPKAACTKDIDQILPSDDEAVYVRGVGGIGKTTLLDMFTYKWAKAEIDNSTENAFIFKFTCRDLNNTSDSFKNLEELFCKKFPEVLKFVSFDDLREISDRVLIVVDGIDELKDLYSSENSPDNLKHIVFDLIDPKCHWLPNHKVIACGRPKAIEFVKKQLPVNSKRKNIEVCGFDDENIRRYINNFFGGRQRKAAVQEIIKNSYDLRIMARVPVFLYAICQVYQEELITTKINTQTELYFFTTLIFIRNHFNKLSPSCANLMEIVNDKTVAEVLLCLMELSATTYMQNKVVFQESDIKSFHPLTLLEETGLLSKHSSNLSKPMFQFRHLFLHEYFTGLHISVTKDITPFNGNRELSSCKPTILGIQRMLEMKENELFLTLYNQLQKIYQSRTPEEASSREKIFDEFVGSFLKIPYSMRENAATLCIDTGHSDCVEFLTLYKESRDNLIPKPFKSANIDIQSYQYKDVRNIVNLINDLDIKNIKNFDVENPSYNEDELYLISLSPLKDEYEMTIDIDDRTRYYFCSQRKLHIKSTFPSLKEISDILLQKSTSFAVRTESFINNSDEVVNVTNLLRQLSSYNKPIVLETVKMNSRYVRDFVNLIKDLNIPNIGDISIELPSYNEDEKQLISLLVGEKYETKVEYIWRDRPLFNCKRGKLIIRCLCSSLNELQDDLLQKSTSFYVAFYGDINDKIRVTDVNNLLRQLSAYDKPITLSYIVIKSRYVRDFVDLLKDLNIRNIVKIQIQDLSYSEDEKHLIALASGEEFEMKIVIPNTFGKSPLECEPGKLYVHARLFSSFMKIPDDVLKKATLFFLEVQDSDALTENEAISIIRRLASYNKPITLKGVRSPAFYC
ncbi:uncharacterized protein [Clytia hemisphaerica]|uniref:NACHT domain-containing protein n=1 Tax=Clytia hemisphaerica TaxID=252671 RepID=A0A7M5TYE1_9CNID|eukprot:TCONS_00010925-protein